MGPHVFATQILADDQGPDLGEFRGVETHGTTAPNAKPIRVDEKLGQVLGEFLMGPRQ